MNTVTSARGRWSRVERRRFLKRRGSRCPGCCADAFEDIAGVALFKLDKAGDAVARLRRAVNAAPEGTPLWRSALWHLGGALEASGKNDQALLYYIKSYVAGAPDPARRSVIESVTRRLMGRWTDWMTRSDRGLQPRALHRHQPQVKLRITILHRLSDKGESDLSARLGGDAFFNALKMHQNRKALGY